MASQIDILDEERYIAFIWINAQKSHIFVCAQMNSQLRTEAPLWWVDNSMNLQPQYNDKAPEDLVLPL